MKRLVLLLVCFAEAMLFVGAQTPLSLEAYKDSVWAYNQNIRIASKTVEAAKAVAKEIRTGYLPNIDASASYNYNFNPQVLSLGSIKEELYATTWRAGAEVNQPIYTGGRLSGAYNSAKIQEEIARLEEDLTVDNITYSAEIAYWNTSAASAYMDLTLQYLGILQRLYKTVQTRFEDGLISKTDLLKVETNLKQAEYQFSKAEQNYTNSCVILNVLMGQSPETPIVLSDSIQSPAPFLSMQTIEEVLERRPDYQIKVREIDLQKEQGNVDRSEFLPKAAIGASADYGTPVINLTGDPLWSPIVYAKVSVPVFYWGKSKHSRDKNKALTVIKELSLSLTQDEVRKDFQTAVNNMAESSRQIEIADANMKVAGESLDLHTFSYDEGRISILDLESAQIAWLQAYISLIGSLLDHKLAIAAYRKASSE